jgi:Tfp pilus assembly protein PilF
MIHAGTSSRVYESLGLAYQATGNSVKARESLKRAVELANGSHRPYLAYGTFLFKEGRLDESLPMLQEAVRLEPKSLDARFELARALYQAGRLQEAASTLVLSVPATGDQCKVYLLRSRILTRLAQKDAAQKEMEVFHSCSTGYPDNPR